MPLKDETGNRYGRLTVLYRDDSKPKGRGHAVYWICKCDCGNIKSVSGSNLRSGQVKSCGCLAKEKTSQRSLKDLTGKRFGRLTVLHRDESKPKGHQQKTYWVCKCDCGNLTSVYASHLQRGMIQSCGCLQKERTTEANFQDITGQQFGFLVPLYPLEERKWGKRIWHCKCLNCGSETDVIHSYLTSGDVKSCGCIKNSYGELKIKQILEENNIDFIKEYSFDDCRSSQGVKLRFDFAIFKNKELYCLIEFQGGQHEKPVDWFGGEESFKLTVERDNIKRKYCKDNNIKLIEISYKDKENLNWNYLKEKCNL